jgi:ribose-phosphate pyrophosphokinase
MIKVDGNVINVGSFPDGTLLVKYAHNSGRDWPGVCITWKYENDREFLCLMYIVKHLRSHGVKEIYLYMPYIPNARQDRVKNNEDIFTLKYFTELLNSLELTRVEVIDPHSTVSEALINNLMVISPRCYIEDVLNKLAPISYRYINHDSGPIPKEEYTLTMFYPDEGAMKRYSGMVNLPYVFGIKKRNWETGAIEGLDVAGAVDQIMGRDILIVDDICSRGGTFYHSAKKLKELGAKDIYLYVSHCENTILEGDLLNGDLIKKVFTTDSIFTKSHEKVEVLK